MQAIKCVIVGDKAVGKTCMLITYTTNTFPSEYVPTIFDNHNVIVTVDSNPVNLGLWEVPEPGDYGSRPRQVPYPQTDVFLVCFTVNSRKSFENVKAKWVPEITHHCPNTPFLLIGTRIDIRDGPAMIDSCGNDLRSDPVTLQQGEELARQVGALAYHECSALTQQGLKNVFDAVIRVAIDVPIKNPTTGKNKSKDCVVQ